MATNPAHEEAPEQLRYKTWILKVSIHCEGCRKKVKKVLLGIEGVYKVDVDSQQHKVTVTGNVEAEALLKKLCRSGKHAELWPENPDSKSKKKKKNKSNNNGNNQAKDSLEPINNDDQGDNEDDHPPEAGKEGGDSGDDDDPPEGEAEEASAGGGKKKKKKKKKKGQNGNPSATGGGDGENSLGPVMNSDAGFASLEPVVNAQTTSMNHGPPRQQFFPYGPPMNYRPPPPPAYGLSYSTAYPSASASYYTPSIHGHYGSNYRYYPPPPPSNPINPMGDDFDHYDDDDEVGCTIM